jgi:hypothetical protein
MRVVWVRFTIKQISGQKNFRRKGMLTDVFSDENKCVKWNAI